MSILNFIWSGAKKFGTDLAVALPSEIISHKVVHLGDHNDGSSKTPSGPQTIAGYVVSRTFADNRAILMTFITQDVFAADETASKNLDEWHKKRDDCQTPYGPGDEDLFVKLLTKLYIALADNPQARLQTFITLGRMTEEDFNHKLNFLENDIVSQWLRRIGITLTQVDNFGAQQLDQLITWMDTKGIN